MMNDLNTIVNKVIVWALNNNLTSEKVTLYVLAIELSVTIDVIKQQELATIIKECSSEQLCELCLTIANWFQAVFFCDRSE